VSAASKTRASAHVSENLRSTHDMRSVHAHDIRSVHAHDIRSVHAHDIRSVHAHDIRSVHAHDAGDAPTIVSMVAL
jgi:hypothetical protein